MKTGKLTKNPPVSLTSFAHLLELLLFQKDLNAGGMGWKETCANGFAAINYNAESKTRRIRTSTDGGLTWQPIDMALPPSSLISTIQQVGDDFYCGHPDGIYRSVDKGKSWYLAVPATEKKVFNLFTHNGVMYALQQEGGVRYAMEE